MNILYSFGYYFRRSSISYSDLFNSWVGHSDFAKRWQKPGDEKHTNVPSMIYPNNSNRDAFYSGSSILVDKGDNIRLKDISLSYKITRLKSKNTFFDSIRIYAYLNNIGIIWKANHDNLDPDYFSGGYPIPRTAALGVDLSF